MTTGQKTRKQVVAELAELVAQPLEQAGAEMEVGHLAAITGDLLDKLPRESLARIPGREPFWSCPRYSSCACNHCPLDPLAAMHGGARHALEGEEPCRARRVTREAIATKHGLPADFALLPHERDRDARQARWEALSLDERERRKVGLWRGPGPILTGVCEGTAAGRDDVAPSAPRSQTPVRREVGL